MQIYFIIKVQAKPFFFQNIFKIKLHLHLDVSMLLIVHKCKIK